MISKQEIEKLALLSRIAISEEEKESFAKEIDSILEYVSHIEANAVSKEKGDLPRVFNVVREDNNPHEKGMYTDAILREAPHTKEGYIQVKKILT